MRKIISIVFISLTSINLIGQPKEIFSVVSDYTEYQLDFYRQDEKIPVDMALLPDSSMIIICSAGYGNSSIMKMDLKGNIIWERFHKGLALSCVELDSNQNIIIAGSDNKDKGWIGKYSLIGDTIWERNIEILFYNHISAISIDENNDIVMSGTARQIELPFYLNRLNEKWFFENNFMLTPYDDNRLFIAKIKSNGKKKWKRIFKPSFYYNHFFLTPDNIIVDKNNIYMSCYHGYSDYGSCFYTFNNKGKTQNIDIFHVEVNRRHIIENEPSEINIKALKKIDDSIYLLSHINNYMDYNDTLRIIKFENGKKNILNYCLPINDTMGYYGDTCCNPMASYTIEDFHVTELGYFIIVGSQKQNSWVLKLDNEGNFIWEWKEESENIEELLNIDVINNIEIIVTGSKWHKTSNSAGGIPKDLIIKKLYLN